MNSIKFRVVAEGQPTRGLTGNYTAEYPAQLPDDPCGSGRPKFARTYVEMAERILPKLNPGQTVKVVPQFGSSEDELKRRMRIGPLSDEIADWVCVCSPNGIDGLTFECMLGSTAVFRAPALVSPKDRLEGLMCAEESMES